MRKEPLKLSAIRKSLASTLDNVSRSNAGGIESAQLTLRELEMDLCLKSSYAATTRGDSGYCSGSTQSPGSRPNRGDRTLTRRRD